MDSEGSYRVCKWKGSMTHRAVFVASLGLMLGCFGAPAQEAGLEKADDVQAQIILTVSEGKRLIAKAVAEMPIVKAAMKDGTIVIARGTTTTYVAEELTGRKIPHGGYVIGWTGPARGGKSLDTAEKVEDIVLIKGVEQPGMSMDDALGTLKTGDIVIKGANALDRERNVAGVLVGSGPNTKSGSTGKIMPVIVSRKVHLIIPIGLEKQVSGDVLAIANHMREPVESLNDIPSMFLLNGHIMTEIEALEMLAGGVVFEAARGGIGGAEGASRLIVRGTREQVERALQVAESIQGEPPFLE